MENRSTVPLETKQLIDKFAYKNAEIVAWKNSEEAVGFSLIKEYPEKGNFIPAKNKKGRKDSVVMIRIWYRPDEIVESKKNVKLYVAAVKASRYLFNHLFEDYNNPDSPTESSISESKASRQPANLEEHFRYELNLKNYTIYDNKIKKNVKPREIIKHIYQLHLASTRNIPFRIKTFLQIKTLELIEPIIVFLKYINLNLFGKSIKKNDNFFIGIWEPYPFKDLVDNPVSLEKPKILGSDFPISYNTAVTFITLFSSLSLIDYYLHIDLFGIYNLIENTKSNFSLIVLTSAVLLFFDRLLPKGILMLINILIRFKFYLINLKIRID